MISDKALTNIHPKSDFHAVPPYVGGQEIQMGVEKGYSFYSELQQFIDSKQRIRQNERTGQDQTPYRNI